IIVLLNLRLFFFTLRTSGIGQPLSEFSDFLDCFLLQFDFFFRNGFLLLILQFCNCRAGICFLFFSEVLALQEFFPIRNLLVILCFFLGDLFFKPRQISNLLGFAKGLVLFCEFAKLVCIAFEFTFCIRLAFFPSFGCGRCCWCCLCRLSDYCRAFLCRFFNPFKVVDDTLHFRSEFLSIDVTKCFGSIISVPEFKQLLATCASKPISVDLVEFSFWVNLSRIQKCSGFVALFFPCASQSHTFLELLRGFLDVTCFSLVEKLSLCLGEIFYF